MVFSLRFPPPRSTGGSQALVTRLMVFCALSSLILSLANKKGRGGGHFPKASQIVHCNVMVKIYTINQGRPPFEHLSPLQAFLVSGYCLQRRLVLVVWLSKAVVVPG